MKIIELDDETAAVLDALAENEHLNLSQLLKRLALSYQQLDAKAKSRLLTDFAGVLADSPSFKGDPLTIQQVMRDEWS